MVAKRYGKRPSEILGITEPWDAYQLDVALAYQGEKQDNKNKINMIENITEHILIVAKAVNPKIKITKKKPQSEQSKPKTMQDWLNRLSKKGTVMN